MMSTCGSMELGLVTLFFFLERRWNLLGLVQTCCSFVHSETSLICVHLLTLSLLYVEGNRSITTRITRFAEPNQNI